VGHRKYDPNAKFLLTSQMRNDVDIGNGVTMSRLLKVRATNYTYANVPCSVQDERRTCVGVSKFS
jgi:hypothetical protein